jgi:MFS family permease
VTDGAGALWRARVGVAFAFAANGLTFGTWAARIPQVRENLGLSEVVLGFALLSAALGAIAAMPITGGLIARYGSRNVALVGTVIMAVGLAIAGFAPSLPVLVVGLALVGVGSGTQDVAMNAHAVEVERRVGRSILSGFHGIFSLGGMLGAGLGGLAAGQALAVHLHFGMAAIAIVALGLAGFAWMLPGHIDRLTETPLFARPPVALLGLGLLAFGSMMAEGSVADWSAVLMHESFRADAATAAFAFAAFSLVMTVGRFAGDRIVDRFGPVPVTRWGAILAVAGFAVALGVGTPISGIIGFSLVGGGLAAMVPLIYRAAAHLPGVPAGTGIAAATTLGYCGFVVGPPLIGFLAGQVGLRTSLGTMAIVLALVAAFARKTELADRAA